MAGFSVELGRSQPTVSWAGDRFLRIEFAGTGDEALFRVHAAHRRLIEACVQGVVDITPAYATLLVTLDIGVCNDETARRVEAAVCADTSSVSQSVGRVLEVPVCFGGSHGPDLVELAQARGLTSEEVVQAYCAAEYRVAFIGFTPGFAYIRGLPEHLSTPRLSSPRARVPAGSVGIAGVQTGVYPGGTPGGWRLVGRTPRRVFDASREPAGLFVAGDRVRFTPISAAEFERLCEHVDRREGGL
ncbi:MAG: 5-oxoprolinase subunit PxpB [Phycisphaerales bacterium]